MGQNQPRVSDNGGKGEDGIGSAHRRNDLKDRVNAKFGNEHDVNPAYGQGGNKGSKGNTGKPV